MKLFFDTEFTGLHKNTTLISIGIISESGDAFYAEFTDYDKSQVNDWIKENVINNLLLNNEKSKETNLTDIYSGNKEYNKQRLTKWLEQFDSVEFVSDVCHYDMVLLIDIFGDAFSLPEHVCASCHDINQDIAKYYNCTETEAFDKSREDIIENHHISLPGKKHNSLYDAYVIKAIYEIIHKI